MNLTIFTFIIVLVTSVLFFHINISTSRLNSLIFNDRKVKNYGHVSIVSTLEKIALAGTCQSKGYEAPAMPEWMCEESTGTSIIAVEFKGGVVIGADSRTTTGAYIANRMTDKITRITDSIYCLRSGSAADTQAVADIVEYHMDLQKIELGTEPLVHTAANIFKELCYNYRDSLTAGIIVAGFDSFLGGQVYCIPIGGMLQRQPLALGGSGSTYIYGFVDSKYKPNMTKDQTIKFVTDALALAMIRDGSSGGVIRLGIITEEGMERRLITGNNIPKFYEG